MGRQQVLWFLLVAACALPMGAPSRASSRADDNLYTRALEASLQEIIKRWSQHDDGSDTVVRTDWKNVIVEQFPEITPGMPSRIGETNVAYLDRQGLINRYKKLHKDFSFFLVHPMTVEGSRVKVWFSIPYFRYAKSTATYMYADWSIVYFRLDQVIQQYVVDEVTLGGI